MRKKFKQGKWVMLMLFLAVWCVGCSDHDGSGSTAPSNQHGDFDLTPLYDIDARIKELKRLLPEETYNFITAGTRLENNCIEDNREALGLPNEPNWEWYYTYENLIEGMAKWEGFAAEGDDDTKKLEIAAFLANIAQETGTHDETDEFGGPGCFIQEGHGAYWDNCDYGGCTSEGVGYCGRGPHQLTWNVNYEAFGEAMGKGDTYLKNPDLLTKEPKTGIAGSIWFWGHVDTGVGDDPEKPFKPSAHDVVVGTWHPTDADKACGRKTANFGVIINIINGGIECGPNAENKQAANNRVAFFKAIAEAMGVTIPQDFPNNCSEQKNFAQCVSYPDPTSRCGTDWGDANTHCRRCCSSDEDCPDEYPWCIGQLSDSTPGGETCSCTD